MSPAQAPCGDPRFEPLRHATAPARFDLAGVDPRGRPFSAAALGNGKGGKNGKNGNGTTTARDRDAEREADRDAEREAVDALALELQALQNLLYADGRFALLVVLQGMDASGKDGTIRGVFGQMNALGVHATSWKVPTETERGHDFLWRIHQRTPARGEVALFNRSHYEDVLVPVVAGTLKGRALKARYRAINDFERMLVDEGTVILKFMLHISKDEQRERLQARLDDPAKHWKFSLGDLAVRERWEDYQKAYAQAISATGTPWAPWIVVPADNKTHRNRMIATRVAQALRGLGLREPTGDPSLNGIVVR